MAMTEQQLAAMEQALEALEGFLDITKDSQGVKGYRLDGKVAEWDEFHEVDQADDAITALRTAIEQAKRQQALDKMAENERELGIQMQPEPVAWMYESVCGNDFATRLEPPNYAKNIRPLYTTPPAAPMQPVADEDELSNGLAMALHDAVLIRMGKDDEATRQAIARIDKLVAKYTNEAAHGVTEKKGGE